MIGLKLIGQPDSEPVSLAEAKAFLAISSADTATDGLVSACISAARKFCENYTNMSFITQTWEFWLNAFPCAPNGEDRWWDGVREGSIVGLIGSQGVIHVPRGPLNSVKKITTYGLDDSPTDFDLTNIQTNTAAIPGQIFLKVGKIWPANVRPHSGVQVQVVTGYGDSSEDVPQDLVQAIKLIISHFFESREPVVDGQVFEAPMSIRALLDPYRIRRL